MIFQGHNIKIVYGVQLITLHISFKKLRQLLYMLTEGTLKALRHIESCGAGVTLHFAMVIRINTGKIGQRSAVFTCQKAIFVCKPADSLFLEMLFGKTFKLCLARILILSSPLHSGGTGLSRNRLLRRKVTVI